MKEEYKQSLQIYKYKSEKTKFIEDLKYFKGENEEKLKILKNLNYIDEMNEKYANKLNESKKYYYINI